LRAGSAFFCSIEFKQSSQKDQTGMWEWLQVKALSASAGGRTA
jgi:hypothetical protein